VTDRPVLLINSLSPLHYNTNTEISSYATHRAMQFQTLLSHTSGLHCEYHNGPLTVRLNIVCLDLNASVRDRAVLSP